MQFMSVPRCSLHNAYSFQVISIFFLTKISLVWCKTVARDLHAVNREKSIMNVFLFRNNVRFNFLAPYNLQAYYNLIEKK